MEGNLLERLDDAVSQLSTVLAEPSKILATMREARKEIEHLRSLAGAVSQGHTFAELREGDEPELVSELRQELRRIAAEKWLAARCNKAGGAVLKAFDGA